jgi:hypothetical protein
VLRPVGTAYGFYTPKGIWSKPSSATQLLPSGERLPLDTPMGMLTREVATSPTARGVMTDDAVAEEALVHVLLKRFHTGRHPVHRRTLQGHRSR